MSTGTTTRASTHTAAGEAISLLTLRVKSLAWIAENVLAIEFTDPAGKALPAWTAGSHIDLHLQPGMVRQYSLCGSLEDESHWQVAVLHQPNGRGASEYVHSALRPGSTLEVSLPRNNFELIEAENYLFIAGGIGITPLLPMIEEVDKRGSSWTLLYGGRHRPSMAFLDTMDRYGDRVLVRPQDEFGHLDLSGILQRVGQNTEVYCCGPEPLLAAAETACASTLHRLHVERFAPKRLDAAPGYAFEVICRKSGKSTGVGEEESILAALAREGIVVESSCENGICGTCETPVLEGDIDHRDSILSADERAAGDTILLCVSRCTSASLVLDI